MKRDKHIIDKVFVEINTRSEKTAITIKNDIDRFLKEKLFPKLEKMFDDYHPKDALFRFDSLQLDLSVSRWENEREITEELEKKLTQFFRKNLLDNAIPGNGWGMISPKIPEVGSTKEKHIPPMEPSGKEFSGLPGKTPGLPGQEEESFPQKIFPRPNREDTFLFFLEKSHLPWFGKEEYIKELSQPGEWIQSLKNPQFLRRMKFLLSRQENALIRFLIQFSREMVLEFLFQANSVKKEFREKTLSFLDAVSANLQPELVKILMQFTVYDSENRSMSAIGEILRLLSPKRIHLGETETRGDPKKDKLISGDHKIPAEDAKNQRLALAKLGQFLLISFREKIPPGSQLEKILLKMQRQEQIEPDKLKPLTTNKQRVEPESSLPGKSAEEEKMAIVAPNAGIILLHPFLRAFFKEMKITGPQGKFLAGKKEEAVQALHFLATGNEEFFEGNMIIGKYLCGIPLQMPVPAKNLLSPEIMEEAENLLKTTIKNWPALKNTSPRGLQQMFLQRRGKLIQSGQNDKIIVERETQDILLEKLQWNISVIKLPWTKKLLFVDW